MFDSIYEEFWNNQDCHLNDLIEEEMRLCKDPQSSNSPFFESNDANKRNMTEAESITTNQKTNLYINNLNNNIININDKINIEINVKKKEKAFLSNKREKISNNKNYKRKKGESKKRNGNAINKIINSCIYNIHYFIKKLYKNIDVDKPTTSNIEGQSHEAKRKLLNKTIYELYCENLMTKRFKGDWKIKSDDIKKQIEMKKKIYKEQNKNKKALDNLLKDNINNERFFKIIKFRDFMTSYLNNENKILKRDEKNSIIFSISLTGFETYDQSFNGEYTSEEKEKYRKNLFDIMKNKSRDMIKK